MTAASNQTTVISTARSDAQIKIDVLSELTYEPAVRVTNIGVLVKAGVVTLVGSTASYGEKWHVLRAAKRVAGVKAIADEVIVDLAAPHRRTDAEIATAVVSQLEWSTTIPKGAAHVTVRAGWITLDGEVEWWYQKSAAEAVLQYMVGVKGIKNLITIRPVVSAANVEHAIRAAFARHALLDARKIVVKTTGGTVLLEGTVASNAEREEAERVAWAAPGVLRVDDRIELEWRGPVV